MHVDDKDIKAALDASIESPDSVQAQLFALRAIVLAIMALRDEIRAINLR